MSRQQTFDVVARMRERMERELARERDRIDRFVQQRDDWGDVIAHQEARDRELERGDSPLTHWRAA